MPHQQYADLFREEEEDDHTDSEENNSEEEGEVFDVSKVLDICYGNPNNDDKQGLYFKVFKVYLLFFNRFTEYFPL